jgi:hypothetical protein
MTVNDMLREAITTDSRKRKCRWQNELESLGYIIIKDRSWYIKNPITSRFIDLDYNGTYIRTNNGSIRFGYMWSSKTHRYVTKPIECIDFVGLLNKNKIQPVNFNGWTNVNYLRNALYSRKHHEKELSCAMEIYKNKIDTLTKEYQKKIEDAKRSYEWSVEYNTKELKNANKNIEKLLHKSIDK